MTKFVCHKCNYQTNNKNHFNDHLNRKISCTMQPANNKIIAKKENICKECNKTFSREDSLKRHNKTYHSNITGDKNNKININGDNNIVNNTVNNIENQYNIENQNNIETQIIIQPVIHKYDYNDINDLTLFEQYLSLTSKTSPYTALLDNLNLNPTKPQYHNLSYKNINKDIMNVHDGNKWIKKLVKTAISNVIDSHGIMIRMIFNRFRIFLSNNATHLIPRAYYYGAYDLNDLYFHKKVVKHIQLHLYNNRKMNQPGLTAGTTIEDIPDDIDDPVFWALSKQFNWNDVEILINKMDDLEINFNKSLDSIKNQISLCTKNNPKMIKLFATLIRQINYHIDNFSKQEKMTKKQQIKTPLSSPEFTPVNSDDQ